MKRIAIIGGGTGTYTALTGLKKYPVHLSAIISMTDSGGSNRVIRDEFGLLPTSDIRQCIAALASKNSNGLIRELFTYRYSQGTGIAGMSFGNLFMAALTDIYGSQEEAIKKTCKLLNVQGDIIPVTYDNSHLVARYENGQQVLGEHYIDEPNDVLGSQRIVELEVFPKARANPDAIKAIREADLVLLGPGDLYTSILCNLVVENVTKALKKTKAKVVYAVNLMTKFGQTNEFTAADHINELEKYMGSGTIDTVLVHKGKPIPEKVLMRYKEEKAEKVIDDLGENSQIEIVRCDLISKIIFKKHEKDNLKRSLIRHDSDKLAKAVIGLLY